MARHMAADEPFDWKGHTITDPTLDESGTFEVGPAYYKTEVQIPATVTCTYVNGVVLDFTISPSESYAGYFGPPSGVVEGPPIENFDRDFWPGVSAVISRGLLTVPVRWQE